MRGRPLPEPVPKGARPTSSRVREALFSIVGHDLVGLRILDAFGGSGLLGFEAASRGASVTVVERNGRSLSAIRRSAVALGLDMELLRGDVLRLSTTFDRFDGVLVDPPYDQDVTPILTALEPVVARWLVLESDESTEAPKGVGGLALERSRRYGGTALHFYRATEARDF